MLARILCFLLFIGLSVSLIAIEWGGIISSTQDCSVLLISFDYDCNDNLIVAGTFTGTLSLGTHSITSTLDNQSFISKRSYEGVWEWIASPVSTTGMNSIMDIKVDNDGNTVVLGIFIQNVTLGGSSYTANRLTPFLAKLDTGGNWLWSMIMGNSYHSIPIGLSIDQYDDIYITCNFLGIIQLGSFELDASTAFNNIYVAKLNPGGFWQWAVAPGNATGQIYSGGLYVSSQGECTFSAKVSGSADFGDVNVSGTDVIAISTITRYGLWQWTTPVTQSCSIDLRSTTRDRFGGVYVLADFHWATSIGGTAIEPMGTQDMIMFKTDDTGYISWFRQIGGGTSYVAADKVICDNSGRIFCGGTYTRGEVGTYPTANGVPLPDYGDTMNDFTNLYLAKFNPAGDWQGVLTAGGTSYDHLTDLRLDWEGNVGVLGYSYSSSVTFGTTNIPNTGQELFFCATAVDEVFAPGSSPVIHTIQTDGYDLTLMWTEVFEDENGEPYTPDGYIVLYSERADDNPEDFYYLGMTTGDLIYTHYGVARFRAWMFYSVLAFNDPRHTILPTLGMREEEFRGMKWSEVSRQTQ
jgi:hypothetical protein